MKRMFCLVLAFGLAGCGKPPQAPPPAAPTPDVESRSGTSNKLDLPPQITNFIEAKEKHARALEAKLKVKVHKDFWTFFRHAHSGDWPAANAAFEVLHKRTRSDKGPPDDPSYDPRVWQTVTEVWMVLEYYTASNNAPKWSTAFGEAVVNSIPRNSIYIGGTDPGRGLPAAFCRSHADGDPFYTLTQNAFADGTYLEYLQHTYGGKIQVPSSEDAQQCFQAYREDVRKRLEHDRDFPNEARQLKPGEDVRLKDNKVQVSGQVAVMEINALITKLIFDRNREHEFYVEESFPLDWMYPHLTPHGFIMKLHRAPLATLPPDAVAKDREFWTQQLAEMIGDWLTPDTPVKEVCQFVEKVHLTKDLTRFLGDLPFVLSDNSPKIYSKLRSSIAGIYNWRIDHSGSSAEQQRMIAEADFALRQAFALCPVSPEAIYRYVNFLVRNKRFEDALLVGRTALRLNPTDPQLQNMITEVERRRSAQQK